MQLALTQRNGVRSPGGARACTPTQSGRPQKAEVASSSLVAPTRWDMGELADPPGPGPGAFPGSKPGIPARPPRTACGSAFVRRTARFDPGWRLSYARAATGRRARLRCVYLRVRVPPGVLNAAAHGCGPAPVKRAVRIGTGRRLAMGGSSMAEQRPLMPEVPGPNPGRPAHACLVATVSMPPRYGGGRGSIPRAGSADGFRRPLHVTVVLAVQHASSPSSQGRFESGRSLAVLAQLVEAQVLGIWRSGFESPGRYLWRANRSGAGRRC
jgi:hypothetical protein